MIKKASILALLALSSTISADALNDSYNIRQKALGGTQVASFKNAAHFYQNPAYLKLAKSGGYSLPRVELGFNNDIFDKYPDLEELVDLESSSAKIDKLGELAPFQFGFKLNINPYLTLVRGSMGITAFSDIEFSGDLQRPKNPQLEIQGAATHTIMTGFSAEIDFMQAPLYIGVAPKYVLQSVAYDEETGEESYLLTSAETADLANNDGDIPEFSLYDKSGLAVDIGFLRPLKKNNGYVGLTVKNFASELNGTKEVASENVDVKDAIPLLITAGTAFDTNLPFIGKANISADYNIVSETDNFYKNLHFGIEKEWKNFLFLRGGLNQGYIVGGFQMNFFYLKVDYAYFVEELGYKLGVDPLTTHNLQIGFSF